MINSRIIVCAVATAAFVPACGIVHAQEGLGGTMAAASISSSMSGMSSSATMTAGSRAANSAPTSADAHRAGASSDLTQSDALFGGSGGSGGTGGPGGVAAAPPKAKPIRWRPTDTGAFYIKELLTARKTPAAPKAKPLVGKTTKPGKKSGKKGSAKKPVVAARPAPPKPSGPPKNWLSHYHAEDHYMLKSGLWSFVSTRVSRYYYRPWSAAMLKADSNHIIGFRTWQEAMQAGYRPDPVSRPEPGAQIVHLASLTPQSKALQRFVEFVYGGQITPNTFTNNYKYITQVASIVKSYSHTKNLVGDTVDQILLASLGEGSIPTSVGGPPPATVLPTDGTMPGMGSGSGGSGSMGPTGGTNNDGQIKALQAGNTDSRTDEFTGFSSRAGKLANVPANKKN